MKKKPAKKKAAATDRPLPAPLRIPPVPPDHPIYQSGYVVGGRYPAQKPTQLYKIADKLAAERVRAVQPAPTGFAAQLSQTIEDVLMEDNDEAMRQVLEKFQRNLTSQNNINDFTKES